MKLLIDPKFMERLVFERSRQEPNLEAHYGREFAACYDAKEAAAREQAFGDLHQKWFESFGFRAMLLAALAEFPLISRDVDRCIVDGAPKPNLQGADLRGAPGRYTLQLRVHANTMLSTAQFQQWARHELMHVEDMLDPRFGFDRSLAPSGDSAASQNLHRERYAVLWALSIDRRLNSLHGPRHPVPAQRKVELARAFQRADVAQAQPLLEELESSVLLLQPTHGQLLERATHTLRGTGHQTGPSPAIVSPLPGAPCPLCRFPTFDWQPLITDTLVQTIRMDYSNWIPAHGICGRCAELYRSRNAMRS